MTIKLLLDENIPPALVDILRHRGFDVKEVRGIGIPGASDGRIMGLARQEERAKFDLRTIKGALIVLERDGFRVRRNSR